MKKAISVLMVILVLCTVLGCKTADVSDNKSDQTEQTTQDKTKSTANQEDLKEGTGLDNIGQICQIGEWVYFVNVIDITRIGIKGWPYENLYTTAYGSQAHNLKKCENYLVFTQANYIYKMDLTTLETEILFKAEKNEPWFEFAVQDDDIYFVSTIGSYTDGIYKININSNEPERILKGAKTDSFRHIQISNNQIYYDIALKGLYRVDLDGTNKKRIIKTNPSSLKDFMVTTKYIFYVTHMYSLKRADIDGKNKTKLVDHCFSVTITADYIIYANFLIKKKEFSITDIYKIPIDGKESERLYEGVVNILGSSGNWIYFMRDSKLTLWRIRLDGSGLTKIHD